MPRFIIQPAANRQARKNFEKTIEHPVALSEIEPFVSDSFLETLSGHYPDGEVYVWGVRPGSSGQKRRRWESISKGDIALFAWDNKYRGCARVTTTTRNADLARSLWRTDDEGRTWDLVYFLVDPTPCSIPYEELNEAVGYAATNVPRGFTVLDEEKSRAALKVLDLPLETEPTGVNEADDWPTTWWVKQGATYRAHRELGIVWAPQTGKGGRVFQHHKNVAELEPGDRVLHYSDQAVQAVGVVTGEPMTTETSPDDGRDRWNEQGYQAPVEYHPLDEPVARDDIPLEWRQEEGAPFTSAGELRQGYLYDLSEDFARKIAGRFPQIGEHFPPVPSVEPGHEESTSVKANPDLTAVCTDFAANLRDAGLRFGSDRQDHRAFVRDFVVSLATKQLVILTGLSGSGKTQIALQFGRWLSGEDDDRYRVVPVRPDWTGPEALFGYEDALQEPKDGRSAWHVPGALEFMLEAADDPDHPYLMVLDEMNLAHVERYFADVISGMESGEPCLPNLREEEDGTWRTVPGGPEKLPFPDNLFIAGTVNVDETTYMFSPKVLDRANTLEFRVETDDLRADLRRPDDCESGDPSLVRGFLEIASDDGWHLEHGASDAEAFVEHFKDLHRSLEGGFSFGHRVLYEALRFAALHEEAGGDALEEALDLQVLQKILPRVHGSRRRVEPVLRALGRFCWDLEPADGTGGPTDGFDPENPPEPGDDEPALPRSFDKVRRMTERLRTNQFVSFTE